jgi:hypothetical protein
MIVRTDLRSRRAGVQAAAQSTRRCARSVPDTDTYGGSPVAATLRKLCYSASVPVWLFTPRRPPGCLNRRRSAVPNNLVGPRSSWTGPLRSLTGLPTERPKARSRRQRPHPRLRPAFPRRRAAPVCLTAHPPPKTLMKSSLVRATGLKSCANRPAAGRPADGVDWCARRRLGTGVNSCANRPADGVDWCARRRLGTGVNSCANRPAASLPADRFDGLRRVGAASRFRLGSVRTCSDGSGEFFIRLLRFGALDRRWCGRARASHTILPRPRT